MKQLLPIAYVLLAVIIAIVLGTTLFITMHHILLLSTEGKTLHIDKAVSFWTLVLTTLLLAVGCWLFAKMFTIRLKWYTKGKNLRLLLTGVLGLILTGVFLSDNQGAQEYHLHQTPLLHIPASSGLYLIAVALYVTACALAIVVFQSEIDKVLHLVFSNKEEPDLLQCFNEKIKTATPEARGKFLAAKKILFEFSDGKSSIPVLKMDVQLLIQMEEWLRTKKQFPDARIENYFLCYNSVIIYAINKYKIIAPYPVYSCLKLARDSRVQEFKSPQEIPLLKQHAHSGFYNFIASAARVRRILLPRRVS